MEGIFSLNRVWIRMTRERWQHIVQNHNELTGKFFAVLWTVTDPDIVLEGSDREKLAVKKENGCWLVAVYKENEIDGFVITAWQTTRLNQLLRTKNIIWRCER